MSETESHSSSSSSFQDLIKQKLRKGLTPTKTRLVQVDGSVQMLEQQCSSTCEITETQTSKTFGFVIDTKPDLSVSCVLKNWLFLSSQDVPNDINLMQSLKITHVLSLLPDFELVPEVKSIIHEHLCLNYYDDLGFSITNDEVLSPAMQFIHKVKALPNGRVLVHCNAGVSRSPSIALLYLMKFEHLTFDEAFEAVKSVRQQIKPNAGFLNQLKQYK